MHVQFHIVYSLAVHLPGEQHVYYQEDQKMQIPGQAQRLGTHLIGWFKLNHLDAAVREFLCRDIIQY